MGRTFAENILGASAGSLVFRKPSIVLSHDNTASIRKTFERMNGTKPARPDTLLIVLDHNAPPTSARLANDYKAIRNFADQYGITKFYDSGRGICHQIMSYHARPGMIITGSDSHTCTAGAFNALAAGVDRTETAGIWKSGETWFRVPESIKITLHGRLREGVYSKDLSLWIIGMLGSAGANYLSVEYHGDGVRSLNIADRMTIANLASEMGAKNAVFPADEILSSFYGNEAIAGGIWADEDAQYVREYTLDLRDIVPLVAAPHHVDNIRTVAEVTGSTRGGRDHRYLYKRQDRRSAGGCGNSQRPSNGTRISAPGHPGLTGDLSPGAKGRDHRYPGHGRGHHPQFELRTLPWYRPGHSGRRHQCNINGKPQF